MPLPQPVDSLHTRATRLAATVAMIGGISVLIGWMLDISVLKRVLPGLVTMKANTALAFALAGLSLWHASPERPSTKAVRISAISAFGTLLIGLLSLLEYVGGSGINIDELLIRENTMLPGDIPGRMALLTAVNFILVGTALLLLHLRRTVTIIHVLALLTSIIAGSGLLGYAYGTEELYRIKHTFTAMALHTSVIFLVIAYGIANARADFPFRRIMTGTGMTATATRQLLWAALLFPLVTGWLVMAGYRASLFGETLAISVFAAANMSTLALLVMWNSSQLFKAERLRKQAEDELRNHEIQLEATVARRTDELHKANAALAQQARYDYLTGLCTRRYFIELAETEWSRAKRFENNLSVLVLDLDYFKRINDTHGHQCGDTVLMELGALLRKALRDIDIVGRMGGEEFAVVLPQTNLEKAVDTAERIRLLLLFTGIVIEPGTSLTCTTSIGVATLCADDKDIAQLLHRADIALYEAKGSGRNRVSVG
jgi:diguanylate cyclase (GGDEF)-like protein